MIVAKTFLGKSTQYCPDPNTDTNIAACSTTTTEPNHASTGDNQIKRSDYKGFDSVFKVMQHSPPMYDDGMGVREDTSTSEPPNTKSMSTLDSSTSSSGNVSPESQQSEAVSNDAKAGDPQLQWFIFSEEVILPEYIVDFEYIFHTDSPWLKANTFTTPTPKQQAQNVTPASTSASTSTSTSTTNSSSLQMSKAGFAGGSGTHPYDHIVGTYNTMCNREEASIYGSTPDSDSGTDMLKGNTHLLAESDEIIFKYLKFNLNPTTQEALLRHTNLQNVQLITHLDLYGCGLTKIRQLRYLYIYFLWFTFLWHFVDSFHNLCFHIY